MVFNGVLGWKLKAVAATVTLTLLAIGAWRIYSAGRSSGMAEVQAQWVQEQLLTAQATSKMLSEARQKEHALTAQIETLNRKARNEANRIRAEHDALIDSLRDRPEPRADAGVPEGARAGVGCTGAGLSRPDAGFLVGLAADAARTQAALQQCVSAYNAVSGVQNAGN